MSLSICHYPPKNTGNVSLLAKEAGMSEFINDLNNTISPDPENNVFADIGIW